MKIRKGLMAAAAFAAVISLTGCAQDAPVAPTAVPTATPDPFHVDVQVPYVTQVPEATMQVDTSGSGSYVAISSDGKVTVLNDGWNQLGEADASTGFYIQLREGSTGPEVDNLQKRLKELGYYTGNITGTFDSATRDALVRFEARYGEQQFGIATVKLQQLLFSDLAAASDELISDEQRELGNLMQAEDETGDLRFGHVSDAVVQLQNRLVELDYFAGEVTGSYDYYTALAVMRFEAAYGRELTGVATEDMQEYLFSDSAREMNGKGDKSKHGCFMPMEKGDEGADVYLLQQRLSELGYADNAPNGKYNKFTEKLVAQFQENCELEATGKADVETLERLFAFDAAMAE